MDELKGACLALAQEALKPPNLFDPHEKKVTVLLGNVLTALEKVRESASPTIAEYVFFPVRALLQQNALGDRQTELVFEILAYLFHNVWSKSGFDLERAQQLLSVSTFLLSPEAPLSQDGAKPTAFLKKPPSFRAAGMNCINALFEAASHSGFVDQLTKSPIVAQIIALQLSGLQHDTDTLECQLACIKGIDIISQAIDPEHRALVLPSVASKLTLFIRHTASRHYRAKVRAINCLRGIIVGCIGDETWDASSRGAKTVRTQKWIETTMEKLTESFVVVKNLEISLLELTGSRSEMLVAIYELAQSVYTDCSKTLTEEARDVLIEIMLLATSQTLDIDLSRKATNFLQAAQQGSDELEHKFLALIKQLPSALDSANESRTLTTLQSIKNVVTLTGAQENFEALIDTIEASLPVSISYHRAETEAEGNALTAVTRIEKYELSPETGYISLSDLGIKVELSNSTQNALASILSEMGTHGHAKMLELFVGRLETLKLRKARSLDAVMLLWMAGAVMRGAPHGSDVFDLVSYCFEDLSGALNVQESAFNSSVASNSHTALACYIVGEAALVQGEGFQEYLVDLVHPLFAMIGNAYSRNIREQAGLAVSKVALACGYSSPMQLALETKDYLVDGISLQLNTLNITPSTPQALASLIYISGAAIIPYLDDVFASLFVIMDRYHAYSQLVTGILSVFRALIHAMDKSMAKTLLANHSSIEQEAGIEIPDFDKLLEELSRKPEIDPTILEKKIDLDELAKQSRDSKATQNESSRIQELDSDDDNEDGVKEDRETDDVSNENESMEDEPEDAVEKWDFPIAKPTYNILLHIAGYCDRLMTHERSEIRMGTLELVTSLIPFLAVNKEQLLPLVHKTWPEAVERVFDNETFVVEQGFMCLAAITRFSEGFVAMRIEKLWPRLIARFTPLLQKRWPQFAPERRCLNALTEFAAEAITSIHDLSLSVLEATLIAYRPALLRGEFLKLKDAIDRSKPSVRDLLWLVLLDEPKVASHSGFHTILPIYSVSPSDAKNQVLRSTITD